MVIRPLLRCDLGTTTDTAVVEEGTTTNWNNLVNFIPLFSFFIAPYTLQLLSLLVFAPSKKAIFNFDHRQFEKKAVNCNLIGPDAGAGIILLSVRGGGCSVVEYYVEVVVP